MKFDKEVLFLGTQEMRLSDGCVYHQVQFYDKNSGPVNVNVMGNNPAMASIQGLNFGSPLVVTFALRPAEKAGRWKLVVDHVE